MSVLPFLAVPPSTVSTAIFGSTANINLARMANCGRVRLMIFPYKAKTFREGQEIYWEAFQQIGDPRVVIILCSLAKKPLRFSEILELLEKVLERTIARLLKQLERNDFISKRIFLEIPPHTEYRLTLLGRTAVPALKSVWDWIEGNWYFIAGALIKKNIIPLVKSAGIPNTRPVDSL